MSSTQEDERSRFKLAQLWHAVSSETKESRTDYLHSRVINEILKDDFNINYKVNLDPSKRYKSHLKDCTALHFSYYTVYDISTFTTLIERGADFTLRNGSDQTVLHLIMTKCHTYDVEKEIPFINSVVSAHVKFQNSANPRDRNGFSHFHGACIANHSEAVKWFLDNGASIDEAVNHNASHFAGYTPLHFSAKFRNFKVVQILVERGANVNAKDAEGKSPLDLLMGRGLIGQSTQEKLLEKDEIIKLLLENGGTSGVGFSPLQIAFMMKDLTIAERLLNEGADVDYAVSINLPFGSDYTRTTFHVALKNSIEAVKMLLSHGFKINFATCIDDFFEKYGLQNLCDILSAIEDTKDIRLSDGETRLLDLISTMSNLNEFKDFLQNKVKDIGVDVPSDSILWPGYTLLHFAVKLPEHRSILEECLSRGLNVNVQDARGRTPIHLAFIEDKRDFVSFLFEHLNQQDHISDVVDEDNLSYLHIACTNYTEVLFEKLLSVTDTSVKFNGKMGALETGSTPLHIVTDDGSYKMLDMLVRHGANVNATNAAGFTPIHCLLNHHNADEAGKMSKALFRSMSTNLEDHVVEGLGLSYLHVACHFDDLETAEKLLDLGSDFNAVIRYEKHLNRPPTLFHSYFNRTPLLMAIKSLNTNEKLVELLLSRGIDKLAKGLDKLTTSWLSSFLRDIPIENKIVLSKFLKLSWKRDDVREIMQKSFGLTKLHIACYFKNEAAVRYVLNDEIDVNAQIRADSIIFAGCTPLHLLMTVGDSIPFFNIHIPRFVIGGIIKLLLDRGADVTIANTEKDTPIHLLQKYKTAFIDNDVCRDLLINAQKNFGVNPTNAEGLSHFHFACQLHEYEVVKKFLQHGSVDINEPIDYFASNDAGCTPLHMALDLPDDDDWNRVSKLVDLLLEYGANVAAIGVEGDTPLHKSAVLCSPKMSILEKLVSYGGDIKAENVAGLTPIEVWPKFREIVDNQPDYATIFEKFDCKINRWNRLTGEGYIGKTFLLEQSDLSQNQKFQKFVKSSDARSIDHAGRTAIHNAVAHTGSMYFEENKNHIYAIESFMEIGIDIDHRDESGQTALHYAARMENRNAVKALLVCGADINIVDNFGKSALSYAVEYTENKRDYLNPIYPNFTMILRFHVQKLLHLNIEVSQLNRNLMNKMHALDKRFVNLYDEYSIILSERFSKQLEIAKTLDIDTHSLTLRDFLCETGATNFYSLFSESKRDVIDNFFKSTVLSELNELRDIIKLQLRKMTTRLGLIDSALSSLRTLLGFSVPDLCEQISQFLLNSDLENLIKSLTLGTKKRKFTEITI